VASGDMEILSRESALARAALGRTLRAMSHTAGEVAQPRYLASKHPVAVTAAVIGIGAVACYAIFGRSRTRPRMESAVPCRPSQSWLMGLGRTLAGVLLTRLFAEPAAMDVRSNRVTPDADAEIA
jgi:hypothetical protein